ncbi:MAG TPA: alkaline phosphatase family protein, partial [Candidatus Polarisedimenticolia bacterium]|nr:alkaline phosphatase family protein [Candidatus Polarisedimenticolia bacterium]
MTAQRRRLLLAVGSAAVLLVAGLAWFSVSRVPEGRLGVISAASDADSDVEIAAPGFHFHAPVRRVTLLRAGAVAHHGAARLVTPEGAQHEIAWRAQLDLSRATPDRLASLARRMGGGNSEIDAVRAEIEGAIVRAARAGFPAPEAVARELEASGLMPGTLSLGASGVPSPAAARPNPLLDSYSGPAWPILVIGVDSADWDLMLPLMEAGELPHLRALKERGAWATLRSMSPTLSPILWTTMATGRPPEEHGILDFLQVDPATGAEAPISRAFRRVKALWNIAGDMRIPSATVGWWATWPAEKVTGAMVTDRVAYSLFDLPLHGGQAGAAYPDALLDDINRLRVPEDSVTYDQFRPILPVSPDRFEEARLALGTPDGFRDPVSHMIKVLASTRTYHRIGVELIRRDRPGLALVYFEGLDEVNHRFAHFTAPPMRLSASADAELREAGSRAVAGFYRFQDRL